MRRLHFYIGLISLIILPFFANAQEADSTKTKIRHRFTTLSFEARAELEYLGTYQYHRSNNYIEDMYGMDETGINSNYGFHGQYFNFLIGGDIGNHISYFFRQRIIPKAGSVSFFDNTDFLYLQYRFNDQWAIRMGKEALYVGGFEYDAAPIDVYYYTYFWGTIHCFQLGVSASYTDKQKKNKIVFQFANSPYIYYEGTGTEWKKGLFSYNLYWNGNYGPFTALYSINFMEYERGSFVNYIALGNKLHFPKWSIYVDFQNRTANIQKIFRDFTLVGRLDWHVSPSVNLFVKGGYEQNLAEVYSTVKFDEAGTYMGRFVNDAMDVMVPPEHVYHFYGIGIEYRPLTYQDLRIHAFVANSVLLCPEIMSDDIFTYGRHGSLQVNVGATWKVNFLKYLPERLK